MTELRQEQELARPRPRQNLTIYPLRPIPMHLGFRLTGSGRGLIKPGLALLTLPLILVTLGLFLLVINIAMVALAEWIAPNFSVDGFWTYVGTVVVVWLVNWAGQAFLDRARGRRA